MFVKENKWKQTFQPLSELDHGGVPEEAKNIEVEEGGTGGQDKIRGGGNTVTTRGWETLQVF